MVQKLPTVDELFKVGAHYGHRKDRTDARSHKYIFSYKNKVSVIDLAKTEEMLGSALDFLTKLSKSGAGFLFVGTKPQAKGKLKAVAESLGQPYVIERWPGGLLTNFDVVIKSIRKMVKTREKFSADEFSHLTKSERLRIEKDLQKKERIFGGLKNLDKKPDVLVVIDAHEEKIAVAEAISAGVPTVAILDTDSNPDLVDYPVIANDDSRKTVELILSLVEDSIKKNFKAKAVGSKNDSADDGADGKKLNKKDE